MKNMIAALMMITLAWAPAFAVPTIHFTPGGSSPGAWSYDGIDTFSFSQEVVIDLVNGTTVDSLVGNFVYIPDLTVSGSAGGPYALTTTEPIQIKNAGGQVLLSGTLGAGDLWAIGTIGAAYTQLQMDITGLTIDNLVGSAALDTIEYYGALDFALSLEGDIYISDMIDVGIVDSCNFSGSMATPAPGSVIVVSIGVALVGWLRRRKAL
jgi:hypothetical protein